MKVGTDFRPEQYTRAYAVEWEEIRAEAEAIAQEMGLGAYSQPQWYGPLHDDLSDDNDDLVLSGPSKIVTEGIEVTDDEGDAGSTNDESEAAVVMQLAYHHSDEDI